MTLHNYAQFLTEKSFTDADVPAKFYVCIRLKADTYTQLAAGVVPGVAGVSASKHNILDWLLYRDAMLVMDAKEVLKINKLSKVLYDSPQYLLSRDLANIARLFNQNDKDGAVSTLLQRVLRVIRTKRNHNDTFAAIAGRTNFDDGTYIRRYLVTKKVRSVRDIRRAMIYVMDTKYMRDENPQWDAAALDEVITQCVREMGEMYRYEAEWLVKDKTLRIPAGSKLYVARENDNPALGELKSRYRVLRFNSDAIAKHSTAHRTKRQDQEWAQLKSKGSVDHGSVQAQLEAAKNAFFTKELATYDAHLGSLHELPVALTAKARKLAAAYFQEKFLDKACAELRYVSEYDVNDQTERDLLAWVELMDFGNYVSPVESAFAEGYKCLDNLSQRLYEHVRVLWHTLNPDNHPQFYSSW